MRLGPTWAGVCIQGDELDRHQHRPTRIFHCADGKKICLKKQNNKQTNNGCEKCQAEDKLCPIVQSRVHRFITAREPTRDM